MAPPPVHALDVEDDALRQRTAQVPYAPAPNAGDGAATPVELAVAFAGSGDDAGTTDNAGQ